MKREFAALPPEMTEVVVFRLGLLSLRWTSRLYLRRLTTQIERAASDAIRDKVGLLNSERMKFGPGHVGYLQYWSSFETLEAWSRKPPHSDWWRKALERMRARNDFGLYHETFVVPKNQLESLYVNCEGVGLGRFGDKGDPVGPMTTSRSRLGRNPGKANA